MDVKLESPGEELGLMFETAGWKWVAKPAIEARIQHLTGQLVVNGRLTLEAVREIQCQIKLLRLMTAKETRYEFFQFSQGRESTNDE